MSESASPQKFSFDKLVPILLLVSLGLAISVGVLWQKVAKIEKGNVAGTATGEGVQPQAESPLTSDKLLTYAKELGLNENDFKSCLEGGKTAETIKNDQNLALSLKVEGTPAFFINSRFLGGAFPIEIFKEVIDKELAGKGSDNVKDYSETLQKAATVAGGETFKPKAVKVDAGDSPTKGDSGAKVTIVEFSDFECPFCVRFYSQTFNQLDEQYIKTGKVKFVFKQFPLTQIHNYAQKAAEATLCAGLQGKFWEMHDKLFSVSASQ